MKNGNFSLTQVTIPETSAITEKIKITEQINNNIDNRIFCIKKYFFLVGRSIETDELCLAHVTNNKANALTDCNESK